MFRVGVPLLTRKALYAVYLGAKQGKRFFTSGYSLRLLAVRKIIGFCLLEYVFAGGSSVLLLYSRCLRHFITPATGAYVNYLEGKNASSLR